MGRKYASIHVFGEDQEKLLSIIELNYIDNKFKLFMDNLLNSLKNERPEAFQKIQNDLELNNYKFLLVKSNEVMSIYDENNSFESIEDKVKKLSVNTGCPILYTSNFDDGVFLYGIYKSGKIIANGKMGPELSAYDMKQKQINIDKLCSTLQLKRTEELDKINELDDISEIEDVVEQFLHIPLDLDIDQVMNDNTYIEMISNDDFYLYNKIKI